MPVRQIQDVDENFDDIADVTKVLVIESLYRIASEAIADGEWVALLTSAPEQVSLTNSGVATDRICLGVANGAFAAGEMVEIITKGYHPGASASTGAAAGNPLYIIATNGEVDDAAVANSIFVGQCVVAESSGVCGAWINPCGTIV